MIAFFCNQSKWEYWKYKILSFTISCSKDSTKNALKLQKDLEQKITTLEQNLTMEENFSEYMNTNYELEKFYDKVAEGVKIHSKSNCCLYGEKCSNLFFQSSQGTSRHFKNVFSTFISFFENLFKKDTVKSHSEINAILSNINLRTINIVSFDNWKWSQWRIIFSPSNTHAQ